MRRLALLFAGCAVWLFLAAIPAFADGGPHVASVNNGSGGLNADSCAGCHRAHTAQTDRLLIASSTVALCLSCHGAGATGATTNVVNGVQFVPSGTDASQRTGVILGALRDGGFSSAAIGSNAGFRWTYGISSHGPSMDTKIPVKTDTGGNVSGQAVTSTHFDINNPNAVLTIWGNGPNNATTDVGATGSMDCATCHNPHGNGQYRILEPQPAPGGGSGFVQAAAPGALVTDAAPTPAPPMSGGVYTDTRNYTVIQVSGGGALPNTILLASQAAAYSNAAGDYFHKKVPWNATGSSGTYAYDAPNGQANFNAQITAWCTTCHTRYLSTSSADNTDASNVTDALYHNRHRADGSGYFACTTCHVAHGSNAQMTGTYSGNLSWPGGAPAPNNDSRLLKLDNRGTCEACHDPTFPAAGNPVGNTVGPTPSPYTP